MNKDRTRKSKQDRFKAMAAVGFASILALTACASDSGGSADGDSENIELDVATFSPPEGIGEAVGEEFFELVEERSDGRLTFNVSAPNTVCDADEIANCVADGRVDVGISIPDYTPQRFPSISLVSVPYLTEDAQALMGALHEVNASHDGAQQMWEENGLHPIAHFSPGRLILGSEEPVESIDDMAGQRWRISGDYLQSAVETAGGNNITLTSPEMYEALQRGVVDSVGSPMDGATQFQLMELLPHWSDAGSGHYTTIGLWMNGSVYEELPEDLREIVDEATEELNGGLGTEAFAEVAAGQCDALSEAADSITRWSDTASEEWNAAIGDELLDQWAEDAAQFGLEDPEGYRDAFLSALEDHEGETTDPMDTCLDQQAGA